MISRCLCLLLVTGCYRGEYLDDTGKAGTTSSDTVVTTGADPEILGLDKTTSSSISTVFTVRWSTADASEGWVEYGPTAAYGHRTQSTDVVTDHVVVVPGAAEDAESHWRVVSVIDGREVVSADQIHTAGAAPAELPRLELDTAVAGSFQPSFRLLTLFSDYGAVLVVDDEANLVWWRTFDGSQAATQARIAPDGSGLYYLVQDASRQEDIGEIVYESWDQSVYRSTTVTGGHHDFFLLPDGSYAYLAIDVRTYDGEAVVGDAIVEIQPDGSDARAIWSTWDNLTDPLLDVCDYEFYTIGCDWTHANSLHYDTSTNQYSISIHNQNTVVQVDAGDHGSGSGSTVWIAGHDPSATVAFDPPEAAPEHQHNFKPVGGNDFIVFDNSTGDIDGHSEAWRYHYEDGTLTATWNFDHGGERLSYVLGDIHLLDNGNYLIGWGTEGEVTEVTPEGDIVWDGYTTLGAFLGFIQWAPDLGGPVRE